jgi:hypothetical protein
MTTDEHEVAAHHDASADALDRQIQRALSDGYLQDALDLARDSLKLRIVAVKQDPRRFAHLSDTLDLTARIVHESRARGTRLPEPATLAEAAECYYAAWASCIPAAERLTHVEAIVTAAEYLVRVHRLVEALEACKAVESIIQDNAVPERVETWLPNLVRTVSVEAAVFALRKDVEMLQSLLSKRLRLIAGCVQNNISAPQDILLQLGVVSG